MARIALPSLLDSMLDSVTVSVQIKNKNAYFKRGTNTFTYICIYKKIKAEDKQRIIPRHVATVFMAMMAIMAFAIKRVDKRITHRLARITDVLTSLTLMIIGDD